MEIIDLPTDWDKPYLIVGYGIRWDDAKIAVAHLREGGGAGNHHSLIIVDEPDAYIQFIPVGGS
jgi:hypothetical protein